MQRMLTQPALRRALPVARACAVPAAPVAAEGHPHTMPTMGGACGGMDSKRNFGSQRQWNPKCREDTQEQVAVISETRQEDGRQRIDFWENEAGAMVAQHDELEDIESCRWAIRCVCEKLRQPEPHRTPEQKCKRLMALRFLLDLEETVEKLSDGGLGTCAIDIFERPWVLRCNDDTEVLRFRPRPDSLLKRAAFAALSPVIAPVGALMTFVKSGPGNSLAAFKWYFRAVMEMPTTVQLDNSYKVEGSYSDLDQACASSSAFDELRRLISVQQTIPQLQLSL